MKKNRLIVIALIIILLIIILLKCNSNTSNDSIDSIDKDGNNQYGITSSESNIAIPGYEGLHLKADSKIQEVSLSNPSQNTCYFVITLLNDEKEVLWKSEYIKPGSVSEKIQLNKSLKKGVYTDCVLKYECFSMDRDRTQMNGAETKLTLWVD